VIKTALDQGNFPHSLGKPGVMAHQEYDITLFPSFIEALCASPHSPSNQQEDLHRTLQGIPLASTRETSGIPPKVMVLEELMTLVLRTKSIGQWPFTVVDGTLEYL
jgi:hypothetical protein